MATYGFPDAIAKFEKVSLETWMNSMPSAFKEDEKDDIKLSADKRELREKYEKSYEEIQLPSRATAGSAGYDFFLPFSRITLFPMDTITIPTGIKCMISKPYMLQLYPRSSHGIKNRISLSNTVGIIDGDYYNNKSNSIFFSILIPLETRRVTIFHQISTERHMVRFQSYYPVVLSWSDTFIYINLKNFQ